MCHNVASNSDNKTGNLQGSAVSAKGAVHTPRDACCLAKF